MHRYDSHVGQDDVALRSRVASGVFDHAIDPRWTAEPGRSAAHRPLRLTRRSWRRRPRGCPKAAPAGPKLGVAPSRLQLGIGQRLQVAPLSHASSGWCSCAALVVARSDAAFMRRSAGKKRRWCSNVCTLSSWSPCAALARSARRRRRRSCASRCCTRYRRSIQYNALIAVASTTRLGSAATMMGGQVFSNPRWANNLLSP